MIPFEKEGLLKYMEELEEDNLFLIKLVQDEETN